MVNVRNKRTLVYVALSIVLFAVSYFIFSGLFRKDTSDTPVGPDIEVVELPEEYSKIDDIYGAYERKENDSVINTAIEYSKNIDNERHLRVTALAMCLDSAVIVSDVESKEYCYTNAKELLQDEPDEITKTELGKRLDALYSGSELERGSDASFE